MVQEISNLGSPVSDAQDWRHALSRFVTHAPMTNSVFRFIEQERANPHFLLAPLALASALETYALLEPERTHVHVALLGVETLDTGLGGRLYGVVPWLLGRPDLKVSIELVGPNYSPPKSKYGAEFGLQPGKGFAKTCAEWWAKRPENRGLPDVFVAFHPGFESHARDWLAASELPAILQLGKPLIVFSYDLDEAERDAAILSAYGAVEVSEPRPCPMGADLGHTDKSPAPVTFAQAMFTVRGFDTDLANEQAREGLKMLGAALYDVAQNERRLEHHRDAFKRYRIVSDDEERWAAHIFGVFYFDPQNRELFAAVAGKELKGSRVSFDDPRLDAALAGEGTPIERATLAAEVYHTVVLERAEAA